MRLIQGAPGKGLDIEVVTESWLGRIINPESEKRSPMSEKRRQHSPDLRAKVALKALKRQVDPANRFSNAFWQKYLTAERPGREAGDRRN